MVEAGIQRGRMDVFRRALATEAALWQTHLGGAALGLILVVAALGCDGLLFGPHRLDVALLSVVVAVIVTARLAGFWASLLTTFAAGLLVQSQVIYAAGGGSRLEDLAGLALFGVVAVLGGHAYARRRATEISAMPASPATQGGVMRRDGAIVPDLDEPLTEREVEVLDLLARGLSNDDIAEALVVSPNTVKTHLSHIYAKLGVGSRTAAVALIQSARHEPEPGPAHPSR